MIRRIGVPLLAALLGSSVAQAADLPGKVAAGPAIEVVREVRLPPTLRWSMDVRWAGDSTLFLAAGKVGVYELQVGSGVLSSRKVLFPELEDGRLWLSARLAVSPSFLVAAAPVHSLAWKRRDGSSSSPELPFAAVVDMDMHQDRMLVLGAQRDDEGVWSPDGAIAWLGSLGAELGDLTPVFFSRDGAGARNMGDCAVLETGAVRFLADGSFLIVPGVEEGVFLYGPTGRLVRTWQADAIGLDVGCDLSPELHRRLASDGHFRQLDYLNRRRTLDEILPLASGPALVVREVSQGSTSWRLELLHPDGSVASAALPVRSGSAYSHIRGDVLGDEVVLLMLEYGDLDVPPAEPPRLVQLRITQ